MRDPLWLHLLHAPQKKRQAPKKKKATKQSKPAAPSQKKTSSKKKSSSKKKKSSSKKRAKKTAPVEVAAPVAAPTITEKKVNDLSQTIISSDGTTGLAGSTFKVDKGDDEGWVVQKSKKKATVTNKNSEESGDPNIVIRRISVGDSMGKIIGRKGETIGNIRAESGANIDTPGRDSSSTSITVSGSAEQVEAAIAAIQKIVDKSTIRTPRESDSFNVEFVGRIVGKRGSTINELQQQSGARINVDDKKALISYEGEPEQIAAARKLVAAIIEDAEKSPRRPKPEAVKEISLAPGDARFIIGRRGATVNQISEDSGCKIDVKNDKNLCVVSGSKAGVADAARIIAEVLKNAKVKPVVVKIQEDQIGLAVGRSGATVKKIESESGAKVNINKDKLVIELRGEKKTN